MVPVGSGMICHLCPEFSALKPGVLFTALHVMQTRYSDENSACPSVRHTRDP